MPLMTCTKNGESGHKWGEEGFCYTGPDSKAKAMIQARAIEASKHRQDCKGVHFDKAMSDYDNYSDKLKGES